MFFKFRKTAIDLTPNSSLDLYRTEFIGPNTDLQNYDIDLTSSAIYCDTCSNITIDNCTF